MKLTITITALLMLCGCVSAKRTTYSTDGTKTESASWGLLVTMDGYQDTVSSPDGVISQTSFQRLTGDVEMVKALTAFAESIGSMALKASGQTNMQVVADTNLTFRVKAIRQPK